MKKQIEEGKIFDAASFFNFIEDGSFWAAHVWGEGEAGQKYHHLFSKICHTYPTMMNLSNSFEYLMFSQKSLDFDDLK